MSCSGFCHCICSHTFHPLIFLLSVLVGPLISGDIILWFCCWRTFYNKNQYLSQIKIILGLVPMDLLMWLPVSAIDAKPDVFLKISYEDHCRWVPVCYRYSVWEHFRRKRKSMKATAGFITWVQVPGMWGDGPSVLPSEATASSGAPRHWCREALSCQSHPVSQ